MDNALIRVPALEKTGIKTFMNGPESFTPDLNYILGEAPQLKGFFVGAGFNPWASPARVRAWRWPNGSPGEPTLDLWPVDTAASPVSTQRCARLRARLGDARPAPQDGLAAARAGESGRPFRRSPPMTG
jgi:4-methylaminobutanoate oxidase (formaldehyde-forming)